MNAVLEKSAVTLTLTAALLGPVGVAQADRVDQRDGVPRITVSYQELDITKSQGLQVLYTRIQHAAMTVCGYDRLHKELARQRRPAACYQTAVEDAIRQVNQPMLTALHRAKSKAAVG